MPFLKTVADLSQLWLDKERTISMKFREIPPGCFRMGSRGESSGEEPRHWVQITNRQPDEREGAKPFWLGIFPVTQRQFGLWKQDHKNHFDGRPDHPAENMEWQEASDFCVWLNDTCDLQGFVACLPSEAQWEYACRAGTETDYYTGDGDGALRAAGWFGEEWDTGSTHEVGSPLKTPNGFGLHDMHGNVWEWCRDVYDEDAYKKRVDGVCDPVVLRAPKGEQNPARVARGGSWNFGAWDCRSAYRLGWFPGGRIGIQGFRVCLFPGPVPEQENERSPGAGDGGRRQADWNRKPGAEREEWLNARMSPVEEEPS